MKSTSLCNWGYGTNLKLEDLKAENYHIKQFILFEYLEYPQYDN